MKTVILSSLSLLLLTAAASASTITVPGDFSTIQAAVDAAVSGDKIVIKSGSYRENVTVITSGISLIGVGGSTKVVIDGAYVGPSMSVTADDVSFTGITFSNGGVELTGQNEMVNKCRVRSASDTGLTLTGTGTVQNTTISTCLGTGLVVTTGDSSGSTVTVLDKNTINHNGVGLELHDGPFEITRNTVANNAGDGIDLSLTGVSTPATLTEISNNDLLANGGAGLLLTDDLGAVSLISKNDIDENGKGLDITTSAGALVIDNNKITESHAGGVFLKTAGATFSDNLLIRNSLIGIVVLSTGLATDGGNTLENNSFETSGGDGVHIESANNVADHNLMQDNAGDGLQVATGADGNQLTKNTLKRNAHDGLDNWGTNTLITGTKSMDNGGADIAGIGDGNGTVDPASVSNSSIDLTDLTSMQELELDTLTP